MKLELKHLTPYLTYSLRVCLVFKESSNKIDFITSIHSLPDRLITFIDNEDYYFDNDNDFVLKPILKPLSLLNIDTEFEKLMIEFNLKFDDESLNAIFYNIINHVEKLSFGNYNKLMMFFYKNHYDINDLIGNKLAININDLP